MQHGWTGSRKVGGTLLHKVGPYVEPAILSGSERVSDVGFVPGAAGTIVSQSAHNFTVVRVVLHTIGPVPTTIPDFWAMIWQYNVSIVSFFLKIHAYLAVCLGRDTVNIARGSSYLIDKTSNKVLAIVSFTDSIKASAQKTIQKLKELEIKSIMLTGDNQASAQKVAKGSHKGISVSHLQ